MNYQRYITIQVSPELDAGLRALAEARGVEVGAFVAQYLQDVWDFYRTDAPAGTAPSREQIGAAFERQQPFLDEMES